MLTAAGETIERSRDDLVFGYRESSLDEPVILEATLVLEEDDPRELAKRMQKQWIIKRANQPMGHQCAGCIFKNPRGASAGELIEKSGLKGTRIGGAVVSDRHANFIVAEPDCTQPGRAAIDRPGAQPGQRPHGSAAGTGSRNLVSAMPREQNCRADRAALAVADGRILVWPGPHVSRWPCWSWRSFPAAPGPSGGTSSSTSWVLPTTWSASSRSRSLPSPNGSAATFAPRPSARPARPTGRFRASTTAWRERIHMAFKLHPWVAKATVTKRAGARVNVDIVYRRPVCMVEVANGTAVDLLPVDGEGVWLPGEDFSQKQKESYPCLAGIDRRPIQPVGHPWGDARVVDGARRLPRHCCPFGSSSSSIAFRRQRSAVPRRRSGADV